MHKFPALPASFDKLRMLARLWIASDLFTPTCTSGSYVTNIAIVYAWEMAIRVPSDPLVIDILPG